MRFLESSDVKRPQKTTGRPEYIKWVHRQQGKHLSTWNPKRAKLESKTRERGAETSRTSELVILLPRRLYYALSVILKGSNLENSRARWSPPGGRVTVICWKA